MQMPDHSQKREDASLNAPPELVSALKRVAKRPVFIPRTVDEAILHSARRHLGRPKKASFRWSLIVRWAAGVAALLAMLTITPRLFKKASLVPGSRFVIEDVNQDGQVDILDAFALATELKTRTPFNPKLDINGDGVVDERDVSTLAARAVSLEKGGHS